MIKKRLKFIFPLFILSISLYILLSLGQWQVSRYIEKIKIISKISDAAHGELRPLPEKLDILNPDLFEFHSFYLDGVELEDKAIFLYAGGQNDYFKLRPFKLKDSRVVLVNQGVHLKSESPKKGLLDSQVIYGVLRMPEKPNFFTPKNEPQNNIWFYLDLKEIADYLQLEIEPYVIIQSNENQSRQIPKILNDHRQYAITWYSFAIILVIVYLTKLRNFIKTSL